MSRFALPFVAVLSVSIAAGLAAPPAHAQRASQMSDLVGAKAGQAESSITDRGYVYITGHSGSSSKHSYYWNARSKNCLHVETRDGRYSSVTDGTPADCNQAAKSSNGAAAAIIGAVVLGAVLAHKSSHHDNGAHYANTADEEQYERGFYDGQQNHSYHNYDRSDSYASGYQAGVDQRNRDSGYHSGRGGYAQAQRISDLQGSDSISAIDAMSSRGFANVDSFDSGNTQYGIFWNRNTRQCVQMTMADGQVYAIQTLDSHPKCR